MAVSFHPLSDVLGLEVRGIDLGQPLDDGGIATLRRALAENVILAFPDQHAMTVPQQIAFSRRFGDLDVDSLSTYTHPEYPEIFLVSNVKRDGEYIGARVNPAWHGDGQYLERPTFGSLLHAHEVPDGEGDTRFANMYAAYEALPEPRKRRIAGRRVIHSRVKTFDITFPNWPPLTEAEKATMPDVSHPLVRTHPDTGRKCLYVGGNSAWNIEGMDQDEGQALIREMRDFATQDRFVYQHRWHVGDALMWDNRCSMHLPPQVDALHRRTMFRTTIKGDRPV